MCRHDEAVASRSCTREGNDANERTLEFQSRCVLREASTTSAARAVHFPLFTVDRKQMRLTLLL